MKKSHYFLPGLALLLVLSACKKDATDFNYYYYTPAEQAVLDQYLQLPGVPTDYRSTATPIDGFMQPRLINSELATLGRVLFYDPKLSKDGKVSCASCHKQALAFGDDRPVSLGVFDREGERNSIALFSVASFASQYGDGPGGKRFFWDNRAATAAEQGQGSMTNPKEMDMTMVEVATVVAATPYYAPLFKKGFGDETVSAERVLTAVAEFVNAIGSVNSKFDKARRDPVNGGVNLISLDLKGFDAAENAGKALYMSNCASCHGHDVTNIKLNFASNGLDLNPSDLGVGKFSGSQQELGTFKVPSLRNVAATHPYFHDGRMTTLHDAVRKMADLQIGIELTKEQEADLVAFLQTLTGKDIKTAATAAGSSAAGKL